MRSGFSKTGPSARPRPGGGFNAGLGSFGEHLDEAAMSQAMTQKAATQQQTTNGPTQLPGGGNSAVPGGAQQQPREVGTFFQELVTRPAGDVLKGLVSVLDFSAALGMSPPEEQTAEQQAKARALHQRYQQLNKEQQAYAQQKYQQELQKKRAAEEEEARRKRAQEEQQSQQLAMPTSPKKGPVGPAGSKKQQAAQRIENDRKQLSGPSSAN